MEGEVASFLLGSREDNVVVIRLGKDWGPHTNSEMRYRAEFKNSHEAELAVRRVVGVVEEALDKLLPDL